MGDAIDKLCAALDAAGAEVTLEPTCQYGKKGTDGCNCWRARAQIVRLEAKIATLEREVIGLQCLVDRDREAAMKWRRHVRLHGGDDE